ncbi:hypothetical protein BKA93DRAFT_719911, partial [Sparassis latifolia]
MKLPSVVLALACAASVRAQYFSDGWSPGQAVTREAPPPPAYTPGAPPPESQPAGRGVPSSFDVSNLLTSGPVNSLFSKLGVNLTEKLEQAKKEADIWDHRIPLITDDNYDEIIVNETLTEEEAEDRVWFLIITVSTGGNNAFSKIADKHFDDAYNKTVIEGDLPNVRWGRIDYLNVTYITTKWNIWQAPYIVVLTDRGQTLRFYKANTVRLDPDTIREFLKEEGWRESEPWTSSFSPGGSREFVMHYFALCMKKIYDVVVRVPKWVLMVISGVVANFVMKWFHQND